MKIESKDINVLVKKLKTRLNRQVLFIACLVIILLFFLLSVFSYVKIFFFVSLLIILNIAGTLYRRYMQIPISMEFVVFGTVLASAAYGKTVGLAVAILAPLIAAIYNGDFSPYTIVTMIIYAVMAFLVPFNPSNILVIGLFFALMKNIVITLIFQFVFSYDLARNIAYFVTDMILNLILFARVAPVILPLMK